VDRVSLANAWALPLGERCDVPSLPLLSTPTTSSGKRAPARTVREAVAARLGKVTWFCFGTRGDVIPVQALALHLARDGLDIEVVRAHTEQEGREILAAVETGGLIRAAPHFAMTWSLAATCPNLVLGPPEMPKLVAGVDLRPPASVVRPVDFQAGAFINWVIENVMRDTRNLWHIGSYSGVKWLPRSMDGETFLKRSTVPNAGRPRKLCIDMGSSNMPAPPGTGAEVLQHPYTFADLEKIQVLLGHAGAGSVAAAGAANVTYVALDNKLDRNYFNPYNCAAGTSFDQDPDAAMLMFLGVDPIVLLYAWRHSYKLFVTAIRVIALTYAPQLAWIVVVLGYRLSRVPVVVFATGGPLSAMVAALLLAWMPPLAAIWAAPQFVDAAYYIITWTGRTPWELAWDAAMVVSAAASSSLFWAVLLLTDSFPYALLAGLVRAAMSPVGTGVQFVLTLVGPAKTVDPAVMGISLAFPDIPLPLFHVRFYNQAKTRRYEGNWGGPVQGMYTPYTVRTAAYLEDVQHEIAIVTSIPWSHFEGLAAMTAPYSVLWNCQSSAVVATWAVWGGLGLGGLVLLPSMLWAVAMWVVAMVVACTLILLLNVVPILFLLLEAAGLNHLVKPLRAMSFTVMHRLTNPKQPLFVRVMHAIVGVTVAWGAPDLDPLVKLNDDLLAAANRSSSRQERLMEVERILSANTLVANDHVVCALAKSYVMLLQTEGDTRYAEWDDVAVPQVGSVYET